MWTLACLALAALPGVVAWWTGRRLLARRDDPALPERIVARSTRLVQVTAAAMGVILFLGPHTPWILALPMLSLYVGGFPTHKALHEERRGLVGYLVASGRWWLAALGLWTLLALTPAIIAAAGPARWPVAALLAAVLVAWNIGYTDVLRRVLGARPLAREDLAPRFAAIVARARAADPVVLRFGFRGGRVVSAFALPSRRRPTVVFGDQLLELLEPDEIAAIFAHEVAHLEHFDDKRLTRARVAMWGIIGLAVVAVPLLGQTTPGAAGFLESAWVVALGFGFLLLGAARQRHEMESDLRALELCGDPEALVRALVKVHALAYLPRRWALDFERNASHPSLARRVQAIRAVGQTVPARFERPLVVPTATPGTVVVLDSERAEWLEGIAAETPLEASALREHAGKSRGWRYSELVELRVRPGSGDKVFLVATERSGSTWSVPLRPEDVAAVQQALDVVDVHLAPRTATWRPTLLVRAVAAVGMLASVMASSALSVFVAGLIVLIRPHVIPLAALAVASIGTALLAASQRDWTADASSPVAIVLALLSAVALAALLLLRRDEPSARDPHHHLAAVTSGALAAVAMASLFPLLEGSDPLPLDSWRLMATVPNVFIAAAGAGAALLGRGRWWGRWTGIALLIVGVVPLGLGAAWPSAMSVVRWQRVTPTLVQQTELDRPGIGLRSSPSGRRLAVQVVRHRPADTPWAFRILGGANDGWELAADDVAFLDDDRLLVARREDRTLRLALIRGGRSAEPAWQLALPGIVAGQLIVSPATGAWTVVGREPESESAIVVAAVGVVGRPEIRVKRWTMASETDERAAWAVTGLETAFEVRTRVRDDWYWRWPLLPALLGRMPVDSEIWHRSPAGDHRLAGAAGVIHCLPATDAGVVCLGYGTTARVVWAFPDGSRAPGSPAIFPASTWKVSLRERRLLGLTSANAVLVLDEDGQRGIQVNLAPETGRSVDALLVGSRLAVLSNRPSGGTVSVYALP
jgi:heat shock protein HtpX